VRIGLRQQRQGALQRQRHEAGGVENAGGVQKDLAQPGVALGLTTHQF
jgi:hypothetical protein